MKQTVTKQIFINAFHHAGRGNQFSDEALSELFDYIEACEDETNETELDVIGLCCDFVELDVNDVLEQYGLNSIEELENNTLVVWHDHANGRVLFQVY